MSKRPTQQFTILQPTSDDVDALIAMHVQSWIDAYPNESEGVSEDFVRNRITRFTNDTGRAKRHALVKESYVNPDYYLRIAKDDDGDIVGFVDARRDKEPELCGLYIAKKMYGTGLATAFTKAAINWLGKNTSIKLTVLSYNDRAIGFYKKMGFEIIPNSVRIHDDTPMKIIDMIREGDLL